MNEINLNHWTLVGLSGPAKGLEYILVASEVRIGRTEDNDIVLPEKGVSRHHATLFVQEAECFIQDMNSKNGTYLNKAKISKSALKKSDLIRIGESKFKVLGNIPLDTPPSLPITPQQKKIAYIALGIVAFFLLILSFKPASKQTTPSAQSSDLYIELPKEEELKTIEATDQQVAEWTSQANAVLQYEDYNKSLQYLKKAASARPQDGKIKAKLKTVETKLRNRINMYDENGSREFEKLNYESAINEWRVVLALSKDFDTELYDKTEQKIKDAENKLKQRSK